MPKSPRPFWLYIVRCRDQSLYTGIAIDVTKRVARHNAGRGARYTASRRPVKLVYFEKCASRSAALKREYQVKSWPRKRKIELIDSRRHAPKKKNRSRLYRA